MRKKEKNPTKLKHREKDKKIRDPKEYIPPQLLPNVREYFLITNDQNTEDIDENNQNYFSNYKPEFIPCKIAEEWNYNSENEIYAEIFQDENELITNYEDLNKQKKNNSNINKEKNEKTEKTEKNEKNESDENNSKTDTNNTNTEFIHKLNNLIKLDNDSDMFLDPDEQIIKDNLPLYLVDILSNEIKWKRPYQYILQYYLWEKVKELYPKKKQSAICSEIIETYKDHLRKVINGEIIPENEEEKNVNDYLSNETETIKNRIYKEFYPILDKEYNIKICDYITRLETEEEYQIRKEFELKEILNKKGKDKSIRKVKRSSIDKDDRKMINVLKISNLILNTKTNKCNSFYTWITSIFQFIIDNNITDLNTKKSILYNIYPQKDGIPVYNPKGKYIIKLYLMGKERKIIIDDKMPFTNDDEFIFPGCSSINEIWPFLFTKALLKLNLYKHRHPYYYKEEEFTDISIIYNLTGKVVLLYDLNDEKVSNFLCNKYNELNLEYNSDYIFGFYKSTKTKSMKITQLYKSYEERINELNDRIINKEKSKHLIPMMQSMNLGAKKNKVVKRIKFKEEFNLENTNKNSLFKLDSQDKKNIKRSNKRFGTIMVKDNKSISNIKVHEEKLIQDGIVKNYLYTLNDYFLSKNFNLKRAKKIKFDDLKIENENSKLEFKQLDANKKLEYVTKRKEIKKRHKFERLKRINELKEFQENEYILYKLNSNCVNLPKDYDSFNLYNDKEILMARKCIANGWKYPPMEFFSFDNLPEIDPNLLISLKSQMDEKVIEYKRNKMNILCYGWTLLNYKDLTQDDYLEEKNLEKDKIINSLDTSERKGVWFNNDFIQKNFDQVIIVLNGEKFYKSKIVCDNSYRDYLKDVYEPNEEYRAFYLSCNKENNDKNINDNDNTNNIVKENYNIDIIFEPYIEQLYKHAQPKVYLMPYINIDVYDYETQQKIFSKITLNKFYSFFHSNIFDSSKQYYIIIASGYFPMGYNLNIISDGFKIENMTRNKIYQQILKYKAQEIDIDFPTLEKNKLWLFGKILIRNNNETNKSNLKFKLNINYSIKQIFPFIHVYLENENINSKRREIMLDEFVSLFQNENETQSKNYITITIKPEYTLKNGNINIDILYDNEDFIFELIDTSHPYEISGTPSETNNNGLIFSEYIYPSEDEIVSFINLDIINNEDNNAFKECDFKLELYQLTNEPNDNFEINPIHFSYSNVGTLLISENFYNSITISNIVFHSKRIDESKKDKNKKSKDNYILPYILICYINDRLNNNFKFDKIKWNIRIFSNYILSFVKDNSKISHENKIKNEWEIAEVGRKLKALKSRKKFIILTKKLNGIELTKEESELLKEKNINEEEIKEKEKEGSKNLKGINKSIKVPKISGNKNKNEEELKNNSLPIIQARNILNLSHFKMPNILKSEKKIENSNCSFILDYVNYIKKERIVKYEGKHENSIMTKSKYRFFNEKINDDFEKSEKLIKKDDYFVKSKEHYNNDIDQKKFNKFVNKFGKVRMSASSSMKNLLSKRNILNQSLSEKIKYEKKVKDIISGAVNLEINELSFISNKAKEILPENFKGLDELDLIIRRKQEEEEKLLQKKKSNGNKKK